MSLNPLMPEMEFEGVFGILTKGAMMEVAVISAVFLGLLYAIRQWQSIRDQLSNLEKRRDDCS